MLASVLQERFQPFELFLVLVLVLVCIVALEYYDISLQTEMAQCFWRITDEKGWIRVDGVYMSTDRGNSSVHSAIHVTIFLACWQMRGPHTPMMRGSSAQLQPLQFQSLNQVCNTLKTVTMSAVEEAAPDGPIEVIQVLFALHPSFGAQELCGPLEVLSQACHKIKDPSKSDRYLAGQLRAGA